MNDIMMEYTVKILDPVVQVLESLSFLGVNSHIVKLTALDDAIVGLETGLPLVLIKYTLGMFLVYPFSAIMYQLPNKNLKHLFSFAIGFFLVQWIFGPDWIHTFITSAGTYLLCMIAPRKFLHQIVFLFVMGYMVGAHMYRMYVSYMSGDFDFTGTQMVLTMKLTSFAYNLYDGTYDYKRVFPETPYEDRRKEKVYAGRRKFAILKLPNPLEFFGYIYCFTCILAGPAFEYTDYVDAVDGTAFLTDEEKSRAVREGKKADLSRIKKPSALLAGLKSMVAGIVCLVLHLVISGHCPVSQLYNPEFIATKGYFFRLGFMYACLLGQRLKFYFAWKTAEGASLMAGFGFEGFDANGKPIGWRGVENVEILNFETAPNIQAVTRVWNKRTQGWLERYTYHRTNKSLLATYFISAIWHGLYPGFFVFFMTVPLLTNIERLMKAKINPILVPGFDGFKMSTYPKTLVANIYYYICVVGTAFGANYCAQTFSMSSLENCLIALGGFMYIPHVALLALYAILEAFPKPRSGEKAKKTI